MRLTPTSPQYLSWRVRWHSRALRSFGRSFASAAGSVLPQGATEHGHFEYEGQFRSLMDKKREDHSYRTFRNINRTRPIRPFASDGSKKDVNVWCSNDCFGLGHDHTVRQRITDVLNQYGATSGGSRNIAGNNTLVMSLERALARHHNKEAAQLYAGGFVANDCALTVLGQKLPGCVYVSDQHSHASMIDGMRHSGAKKVIWKHNDPVDLEEKLASLPENVPKIICFESVYSLTGTIAPIPQICDLAKKYGALTFCDEGHALGFYGKTAAGVVNQIGYEHQVDIISAGLGKALGTIGGYIASSEGLIDTLRSFSRGMIFTSVTPPPYVAGAEQSLRVISRNVELRKRYHRIVASIKNRMREHDLPLIPNQTHLLVLMVGGARETAAAADLLYDEYRIYMPAMNSPTVPVGTERLRIQPSVEHTEEHVTELVDALSDVWNRLGLRRLKDWKYDSDGGIKEEWMLGRHEPPIWTERLASTGIPDEQALTELFRGYDPTEQATI